MRTIRRGDKVSGLVDCQSDEMFVIVCAQVESVLERSAIRVLSAHEKKYKKRTNVVIRLDCVHPNHNAILVHQITKNCNSQGRLGEDPPRRSVLWGTGTFQSQM